MINENVQIIDENESEFVEIMPSDDHQTEFGVTLFKAFLKTLGTRKSEAAILRSAQVLDETFTLKEALISLEHFKFNASFTHTNMRDWQADWLPLLAIQNDGTALIVTEIEKDSHCLCLVQEGKKYVTKSIEWANFRENFSGYTLLARKMTSSQQKSAQGHWFFSAFKTSKWLYFQVVLAAIVSNFLALTTSIFTMTVYDRIIPNSAIESLYALSVGVVAALAIDFIIKMLRAYFIDVASKRADLLVSGKLFDRILSLNTGQKSGSLAGIIREFETLREFFTSSTLVIIVDLPFMFFFAYVIYLIAGPLGYVPLVGVPLVLIVGLIVQPFMSRATKLGMESGVSKQGILVETINGLETVKATGAGPYLKRRYSHAQISQSDTTAKTKAMSQFVVNVAASFQQFAQIAIIFFGVFLVRDGEITQGALIAAVILGGRAMAPMGQLANVLSRANGAKAAYKSLNDLFNIKQTNIDEVFAISRGNLSGTVEFRNVTYSYSPDAQPIIENVNIKIPHGQKVALVGKMGSGKSTIAKIITGSLKPTQGNILIDDVDLQQLDPADVTENIGVMPQDSWLFSGSIQDNITSGRSKFTDDDVLEVSRISTADEFISQIPQGYDFEIKEKGVGLSGGQKQAICLARSILNSPNLIVLDEPTSSMDQQTEAKVVENLNNFLRDKTLIAITHRNALLSICDRVLVIEGGKIIADSTPEQLGVKKLEAANVE